MKCQCQGMPRLSGMGVSIMKKCVIRGLCFLVISLFFNSTVWSATQLQHIYCSSAKNATRITFSFDQPFSYQLIEDWQNKSIHLKFSNTRLHPNVNPEVLSSPDFTVSSFKVRQLSETAVGVELKTAEDFQVRTLPVKNSCRLVLEITPLREALQANEHYRRGLVYENRGENQKALAEYRSAIALQPGHPDSYFHAGIIRMKIGDTKKAIINFKKVPPSSSRRAESQRLLSSLIDSQREKAPLIEKKEEPSEVKLPQLPEQKKPDEGAVSSNVNKDKAREAQVREQIGDVNSVESVAGTNLMSSSNTNDENTELSPYDNLEIPEDNAVGIEKETPGYSVFSSMSKENNSDSFDRSGLEWENLFHFDRGMQQVLKWWYLYLLGGLAAVGCALYLSWKTVNWLSPVKGGKGKKRRLNRIMDKELKKEVKKGRIRNRTIPVNGLEFARQISDIYSQTNREFSSKSLGSLVPDAPVEVYDDPSQKRGRKIERELESEDIESVKLAKKFRQNNTNVPSTEQSAIYFLRDRGWTVRHIAQKLELGEEEVRLALSLRMDSDGDPDRAIHTRETVYQIQRKTGNLNNAAKDLKMSTGEVELALNLRNREKGKFFKP